MVLPCWVSLCLVEQAHTRFSPILACALLRRWGVATTAVRSGLSTKVGEKISIP